MRTHVAHVRMIAALIFSFHISTAVVFADPLEDGRAAYNRGDYATALKLFRSLAEQGNADAQNDLGWAYEQGIGVQQDFKEAIHAVRVHLNNDRRQHQLHGGPISRNRRGTDVLPGVFGSDLAIRTSNEHLRGLSIFEGAQGAQLPSLWPS